MRSCFIPLCDSFHKTKKKRRFFLPSVRRLKRWQEILTKHNLKTFRETDKLCEFHFNPDDIETNFSTVIQGQVVAIERARPKLKDEANPCRNLSYPRKKAIKETTPLIIEKSIEEVQKKPKLKKVKVTGKKPLIEIKDNDAAITEETPPPPVPVEDVSSDFLNLYEEVYEVILPSTLWAVFRCPQKEFISFVCINPVDFKVSKQIVLLKSGKYTVKLYEEDVRTIHLTSDKITSDYLSKDIEEIDSI